MDFADDNALREAREYLLTHPVYRDVTNLPRIRRFMEYHVFAVWDFMSLLKALQRALTTLQVPWIPPDDREAARLINEIVLGEESDEDGLGGYMSHFELYRQAMLECGADTHLIDQLVNALARGASWQEAVDGLELPSAVRAFLRFDFDLIDSQALHRIAAAFFFGREDIIPAMFRPLVLTLSQQGAPVQRFLYYLNRHIEVDEGQHGPRASRMVELLCHNDPRRLDEARETALQALRVRGHLWDAAHRAVLEIASRA
ncbi:MAG: DUF3050 domain-containing protein [Firmicutes bacterium]|nr:DUF3050 domain-containing protein [Bacillota bacterium]